MRPFKNWSAVDFVLVGVAALCLSMVAKHLLGNDLGYTILSWVGEPLVFVGILLMIRDRQ